jgi:O-acetylserine/cysteine efflux transporter
MRAKDVLLALFVILIWGFNILVVKLGTRELPPFLLTGLRFLLAAGLLVPFRPRPFGKMGLTLVLALVLGVGHFGLLFAALRTLDAATTAISMQLCAPFSALLSLVFYRERMGALGWFGMLLAIGGVALIEGGPTRPDVAGFVMAVVSAFAWSLSNIVVKAIGPTDIPGLNGWVALFGAPMVLALSAFFEKDQIGAITNAGMAGWAAVASTAVGATIISYTVWYRLIGRLAVNRVVPFMLLTPVITVAGSGVLLGEKLTWLTLLGGGLTILGVAAIQFRRKPARRAAK